MPIIRNPGPWTFAIFACASLLVGFLFWRGAPEAVKLAGSLVGVAVAAFGAKSALAVKPRREREEEEDERSPVSVAISELAHRPPALPSRGREPLETWPEIEVSPDTIRNPSRKGGDA